MDRERAQGGPDHGPRTAKGSTVLQAMAAHPRLAPGIGPLQPYAGSSWWALTADAARYVLDFAAREPSVVRFFENTRSPDEGFFQTVLANSSFAPAMRRGLTYSDWKRHGSHPAVITTEHVEAFARPGPVMGRGVYGTGELCFARKFPDDGGAMTSLVDAVITTHQEAPPTAD